jgi:hypothetical protein
MIDRTEIIELIREQIKDQYGGELELDLQYLKLDQPHIAQWIDLFGLTEGDISC